MSISAPFPPSLDSAYSSTFVAVPPAGPVDSLSPFGLALPAIPSNAVWVDGAVGSDSTGTGSIVAPYATINKGLSQMAPGKTLVLKGNQTYGTISGGSATAIGWNPVTQGGTAGTALAPINVIGDPGTPPRPIIAGRSRMNAPYMRFWNMTFKGPTGIFGSTEDVLVWGDGLGLWIVNSEVTGDHWHAGLFLGSGAGSGVDTCIFGCYIHDNGSFGVSAEANVDHGVYWNNGQGKFAGNLCWHNFVHGAQWYPNAGPLTIAYNTMVANGNTLSGNQGSGIMIANDGTSPATHDCQIANNIVASDVEMGIRTSGVVGSGNTMTNNNVFGNGGSWNPGSGEQTGLVDGGGNFFTNPLFNNAAGGDFTLQAGSPALGHAGCYQNGQTGAGWIR
jgi:hypothetical protein